MSTHHHMHAQTCEHIPLRAYEHVLLYTPHTFMTSFKSHLYHMHVLYSNALCAVTQLYRNIDHPPLCFNPLTMLPPPVVDALLTYLFSNIALYNLHSWLTHKCEYLLFLISLLNLTMNYLSIKKDGKNGYLDIKMKELNMVKKNYINILFYHIY